MHEATIGGVIVTTRFRRPRPSCYSHFATTDADTDRMSAWCTSEPARPFSIRQSSVRRMGWLR
jgi:hypothetical protein